MMDIERLSNRVAALERKVRELRPVAGDIRLVAGDNQAERSRTDAAEADAHRLREAD